MTSSAKKTTNERICEVLEDSSWLTAQEIAERIERSEEFTYKKIRVLVAEQKVVARAMGYPTRYASTSKIDSAFPIPSLQTEILDILTHHLWLSVTELSEQTGELLWEISIHLKYLKSTEQIVEKVNEEEIGQPLRYSLPSHTQKAFPTPTGQVEILALLEHNTWMSAKEICIKLNKSLPIIDVYLRNLKKNKHIVEKVNKKEMGRPPRYYSLPSKAHESLPAPRSRVQTEPWLSKEVDDSLPSSTPADSNLMPNTYSKICSVLEQHDEMTISEISAKVGKSKNTIRHHIKKLQNNNLVMETTKQESSPPRRYSIIEKNRTHDMLHPDDIEKIKQILTLLICLPVQELSKMLEVDVAHLSRHLHKLQQDQEVCIIGDSNPFVFRNPHFGIMIGLLKDQMHQNIWVQGTHIKSFEIDSMKELLHIGLIEKKTLNKNVYYSLTSVGKKKASQIYIALKEQIPEVLFSL